MVVGGYQPLVVNRLITRTGRSAPRALYQRAYAGLRPRVPPEISPYKITSDFTGFNAGFMGFHGFSTGRRSSQHGESKADMTGAETVV
eukprot:scaffold59323_cov24-Cyclotella_meneghiniana.AAC.1